MSRDTGDNLDRNPGTNTAMATVMDIYLSRRSVMRGGLAAAVTLIAGTGLGGCVNGAEIRRPAGPGVSASGNAARSGLTLGFDSIPGSRTDACTIAKGYRARVLAPWGTPLNRKAAPWKPDGSNTAVDQANAMGMHHDGMHFFPIDGSSDDGLLAINFEYIDPAALHPAGPTRAANGKRPAEEVRKEINAHGAGVVRLRNVHGHWQVVENDPLNRRFTTASPMHISGPLRGTAHVKTPYSTAVAPITTVAMATRLGAPTSPAKRTGQAFSSTTVRARRISAAWAWPPPAASTSGKAPRVIAVKTLASLPDSM